MTELIQYQYNLHPNLEIWRGNRAAKVGNTGLIIHLSNKAWCQHFLPDEYDPDIPTPEDELNKSKYSYIYPYALWHFINSGILITENQQIVGSTNKGMNNFRTKLLTPSIYSSTRATSVHFRYNLYLGELIKNSEILEKLEKIAQKCARQNYLMSRP